MVLDVRAQVVCNLGPVISGSVRDDHVQGQGLVFTTGELVIAGLITPAHGDLVLLAYITPDGNRLVRFPRSIFRVTKAFANPLSNQTQVSIANELAFLKGKGGGVINSTLVDALNGRAYKEAPILDLRDAFAVMADRTGIDVGVIGQWDLKKQLPSLEAADYVNTMSDILASVSRFGYLDAQNILQTSSYQELPLQGPVLTFDQVIDLEPNDGGSDFTETPIATGEAQQLKPEPDPNTRPGSKYVNGLLVRAGSYGEFNSSWENSSGSTSTTLKVTLKDGTQRSYAITERVETSTQKAEPDNRTMEQTTVTTTALVKVNSQIVQDFINAGLGESNASTTVSSRKSETFAYEQIDPPPLNEQEQQQQDQEINSARQALAQGQVYDHPLSSPGGELLVLPKLPTFRKTYHEASETMSYAEALGRIGIVDYAKVGTIPSGEGLKEVVATEFLYSEEWVKEFKRTFVAYGLTQMGQQALSAAATKPEFRGPNANLSLLLDQFFALVLEDFVVDVQAADKPAEDKPIPQYLANFGVQAGDTVIQGGSRMQVGQTPPTRPNRSHQFAVPFLPDDVVTPEGVISKGNANSVASDYAEQQNRLLLGHRLGLQVTTALGVLPTQPLAAFHLQKDDIVATYRINGTCWTFNANSCLVSTDALYWGLAGGDVNGPRWTPVAPGTTALPVPPAETVLANPVPANSVALQSPVDVSDQAAVDALLAQLPDSQTDEFAVSLMPVALALPFKPIIDVLCQVRLESSTLVVPFGINRSMGEASLQVRLQQQVASESNRQVRLQLESGERQILAETFAARLNLSGNLS